MKALDPRRQFATFLGVGGVAALANLSSRFLFASFASFEASVLLAFFVGLTTAFVLNRALVFSEARGTTWKTEAVRFLIVNLAGLVVTLGAAVGCLRVLLAAFGPAGWVEGLAHLIGLGCSAITSYVAHRTWTFAG